jgi:membrane protein YqaA with SNARE-associated domain
LPAAELFATYGLPGLFLVTALSGSVVPLPSEALLAALIWKGQGLALAVVVATAGNTLGAATLFWLGGRLARGEGAGRLACWLHHRTGLDGPRIERARAGLRRFGPAALLLTWLPIAGDAVVIAAGFAGVSWTSFAVFATLGKAVRFAVVAGSVFAALS